MPESPRIVQVAVPTPLMHPFDYRIPAALPMPAPGVRVRVPFGRRQAVGIVLGRVAQTEIAGDKLKSVLAVLDDEPILPPALLELIQWAAGYYHHPIGDVIQTALPVLLRRGDPAEVAGEKYYALNAAAEAITPESFKRSPLQRRVFEALRENPAGLNAAALSAIAENWRAPLKRLEARGLLTTREEPCLPARAMAGLSAPALSEAQQTAVTAINTAAGAFSCQLLHGVTGSGKTEVYLRAIEAAIARGGQVLVLVPEIGLTPQLLARFTGRIAAPIAVLHSALNDSERLCAWQTARLGEAAVVIGTRS
ncbi:MAG: DEAD/DEAH box helicase family protein, partial [Gammaproteobacteria bacterium]|nr:DEAD/DEAH box helicase family protein [Gammaproteobacteria bacterium]